jgi:hypothetical protein
VSTATPPDLALAAAFPPTSRYHAVGTARHTLPGGDEVVHLRRRFIPAPDRFHVLHEHTVIEGERHDTLAAQLLGDPEQFWRICDANAVLFPEELTETPGRRVRVTLPEGVPGTPSA